MYISIMKGRKQKEGRKEHKELEIKIDMIP